MNRAVFVFGTGRSGTSAVAMMLSALGVHMGSQFTPVDRNNKWGTGEDVDWMKANRDVLRGASPAEVYPPLIKARSQHAVWGAKDPAFARVLTDAVRALEPGREPLVVVCRRRKAETINSFMRAYHSGRIGANQWYDSAILNVTARLDEFQGRVLEIWWEDVLADPMGTARKLAAFVGLQRDRWAYEQSRIEQAAEVIRTGPRLRGRGFGDIAVGVRIASHPAVPFFVSWTLLLTGGLRSGDTVLMPQAHSPAHHAGTKMARDFLRTSKDTLLMVDDDMAFKGDQLHRMREAEANQEFDVVMAFATHRTHPPKPVMLHWQGPTSNESTGQYSFCLPVEKKGTAEVDAVGLAFTLIRRRVLEAMIGDRPLKLFFPFKYGAGWESDDMPFSAWCRENGFRMGIDLENDIGHLGCHSYGWDDYVEWQENLAEVDRAKLLHRVEYEQHVDVGWDVLSPIIKAVAEGGISPHQQTAMDILKLVRGQEDRASSTTGPHPLGTYTDADEGE